MSEHETAAIRLLASQTLRALSMASPFRGSGRRDDGEPNDGIVEGHLDCIFRVESSFVGIRFVREILLLPPPPPPSSSLTSLGRSFRLYVHPPRCRASLTDPDLFRFLELSNVNIFCLKFSAMRFFSIFGHRPGRLIGASFLLAPLPLDRVIKKSTLPYYIPAVYQTARLAGLVAGVFAPTLCELVPVKLNEILLRSLFRFRG